MQHARRITMHFFRQNTSRVFAAMLTLPIGILVFNFNYLPFQDYPNWLYQGHIFNRIVFHGDDFNGFFSFQPYLPPNAISSVAIGVLSLAVDIFIAGKIFLFLTALGLYTGIIRYLRLSINKGSYFIPVFAFYLVLNLQFLSGYINFVAGIALALHGIVYLVHRRYRCHIGILSAGFLLCYLFHFFSFLSVFLFLGIHIVYTKQYRSAGRLVLAALPTVAVFVHYLLSRTIGIVRPEIDLRSTYHVIRDKFLTLLQSTIPFHHFKWVSTTDAVFIAADYLFSGCILVLFALVFFRAIRLKQYSLHLILTSFLLIVILFLPTYGGGLLLPGERLVLFCMVNLVICGFLYYPSARFSGIMTAIIVLFSVGSFAYNVVNTAAFDEIAHGNMIPADAVLRPNLIREGTNGFLHFRYYKAISNNLAVPCFSTGLFRYPNADLYERANDLMTAASGP